MNLQRVCTSTLSCRSDTGSIALNMVGALEGKSFIFNGVILPKSPLKLESVIRDVFNLILGESSNTSARNMSMVYHVNNRVATLGDDLIFNSISKSNEHVLNIYMAKGTMPVGAIYLNTHSFKPTFIGYADSIKGFREGKERNDDSIIVLGMCYCHGGVTKRVHIGIVADGVSSLGRGYYVSSEAIKVFAAKMLHYVYTIQDLTPEAVDDMYRETARAMLNLNISNNMRAATTFTAFVYPVLDKAYVVHVGDTRIYLFSRKRLTLLTEDHKIPGTNTLTKAIGIKVEEPMTENVNLNPGDGIVMVSDGVYSVVKENELGKLLLSAGSPVTIVNNVLSIIRARKGSDDASIGIIRRLA